jgi:Ca2+-transporting ATPase
VRLVTIAYGVTRHDWLNGLLAGITLAMANLPEEFPVVLTVFLALGGWRISRKRVLTRQPAAIETLGATTVLCVDKTGTLTENRMAIVRTWALEPHGEAPHGTRPAAHPALRRPRQRADGVRPMDVAFHRGAGERSAAEAQPRPQLSAVARPAVGRPRLEPPRGDRRRIAAKGAPEAIVALCRLDDAQRATVDAEVARMAAEGLRVIAVASARCARARRCPRRSATCRCASSGWRASRIRSAGPSPPRSPNAAPPASAS